VNLEGLSEFLVLREARGRPRSGNCQIEERGAEQICCASPRPIGADFLLAGEGSGDEAEAADHPECLSRGKPEQRGDDAERPQPGTYHVIAVNPRDVVWECSESEPDAGGGAEKGGSKQQIIGRQIKQLPRVPNHGERIEGQTLRHAETGDRGHAEKRRAEGKNGREAGAQPIPGKGQKGGARALNGQTRA